MAGPSRVFFDGLATGELLATGSRSRRSRHRGATHDGPANEESLGGPATRELLTTGQPPGAALDRPATVGALDGPVIGELLLMFQLQRSRSRLATGEPVSTVLSPLHVIGVASMARNNCYLQMSKMNTILIKIET